MYASIDELLQEPAVLPASEQRDSRDFTSDSLAISDPLEPQQAQQPTEHRHWVIAKNISNQESGVYCTAAKQRVSHFLGW
jgi:hypothetical protein